jgi:cell division protein FtsB
MDQQTSKASLFRKVLDFFDKLEDKIRGHLSKYPIAYTLIGGTAMILFWRGVWHTADILQAQGGFLGWLFYEPINMVIVTAILLATGLFVSYFIGDTILISGLKHEKKTTDKTEKEVQEEEQKIKELRTTIKDMKKEVDEIKDFVEHVEAGKK